MWGERNEFSLAAVQRFQPLGGKGSPRLHSWPSTKYLYLLRSDGRRMHRGGALQWGGHEACFPAEKAGRCHGWQCYGSGFSKEQPWPCGLQLLWAMQICGCLNICLQVWTKGDKIPLCVAECLWGLEGNMRCLQGKRAQGSKKTGGHGQGRCRVHPHQSKVVSGGRSSLLSSSSLPSLSECSYLFLLHYFKYIYYSPFWNEWKIRLSPNFFCCCFSKRQGFLCCLFLWLGAYSNLSPALPLSHTYLMHLQSNFCM